MEQEQNKKFVQSAFDRILFFLGRRNHSEKEIRQKLRGKFEPDEIERGITKAKEFDLLPNDEQSGKILAEQFAVGLHRKNKGILFIQGYLRTKGLPNIDRDREVELEKAKQLLKRQGRKKSREQLTRFFIARGFERDVISEILRGHREDS